MGLFDRLRRRGKKPSGAAASEDVDHLREWAEARRGVEAFLEPPTVMTQTTLMLVAHDGEWTRRRVAGHDAAFKLARKLRIPIYEVAKVGYPQRMRDRQARERALRKRAQRQALED